MKKENPKDPFQSICYINDKICGKGNGNSKKAAKNNAAEEALKVLIPEYQGQNSDSKKNTDDMYAVIIRREKNFFFEHLLKNFLLI